MDIIDFDLLTEINDIIGGKKLFIPDYSHPYLHYLHDLNKNNNNTINIEPINNINYSDIFTRFYNKINNKLLIIDKHDNDLYNKFAKLIEYYNSFYKNDNINNINNQEYEILFYILHNDIYMYCMTIIEVLFNIYYNKNIINKNFLFIKYCIIEIIDRIIYINIDQDEFIECMKIKDQIEYIKRISNIIKNKNLELFKKLYIKCDNNYNQFNNLYYSNYLENNNSNIIRIINPDNIYKQNTNINNILDDNIDDNNKTYNTKTYNIKDMFKKTKNGNNNKIIHYNNLSSNNNYTDDNTIKKFYNKKIQYKNIDNIDKTIQ